MKLELLEDLYVQQLAELRDAERQLARILRKLAKTVSLDDLRKAFEDHTKITREQTKRLEEILARRGGEGRAHKSKAMSGLLFNAKELLKHPPEDRQLLEAALISAAQKVEAFETAAYAGVHTYAKFLGYRDDMELLERTYQEEKKMEDQLTGFGENLTFEAAESETPIEAGRGAAQ